MKKRIAVLVSIFLFISCAFASWDKKPEFRWTQFYRYDSRRENHQLYTNRLSSTFNYLDNQKDSLLKLTPFFEIRRNINKDLWERKELGVEIGKDIFPWFYLGEAIQQAWTRENYRAYSDFERRDSIESETRLIFSRSLFANKYINLKGFFLDEYTYDFNQGRGIRNEVAIGLIMPIGKYVETSMSWRHIDRIHYYDSDTLEASLTLVF